MPKGSADQQTASPLLRQTGVRVWRLLLAAAALAAAALVFGGCDDKEAPATPPSPETEARQVGGGCGATPLLQGVNPEWTASARPPNVPYALGREGAVAAFPFARPLRAGHPQNPANKILWVVRLPRNGESMRLVGRPIGGGAAAVRYTLPSNSGPGEIYPSIIDVPRPGCWHFTLTWGANTDQLDLSYDRA